MRKPLVSPMLWMARVTVQTFLVALVVGPLLTPVYSAATVFKENGTASDANFTSDPAPTTIASFLQDIFEETTLSPQLSNQVEELTTTIPSLQPSASVSPASVSNRHSGILTDSSAQDHHESSQSITKTSVVEHDDSSSVDGKPQKNGTTKEEEGENESSTEQSENDDDNALPTTTDRDTKAGLDDSAGVLSNDRDQDASLSADKDESDTYFSAGDAAEGDSVSAASGGEEGDTIFPPGEDELDTDESMAPTTYASLLRPNPTFNPQSFSSQLGKRVGLGGSRPSNGRIGTRGLSSKSELNSIPLPTPTSFNISAINKNETDSDSVKSSGEVTIAKDKVRDSDISNYNSSSRSNIDSTFYSRSNAHVFHPQQQQLLRARPTTSVINVSSSTSSNNRIVKRKKIPIIGGSRSNTTGSSLSSIYGNSLLTSSTLSSADAADEIGEATTASSVDALLSTPVESTTVSNSLLNTSQDDDDHDHVGRSNSNNRTETAQREREQHQGSPSFTSGVGSSNSTTPATPNSFAYINGSNNNSSSNATVSSSRAILGFGTSSSSSHGKVKRPKPIIIRDHEESLYVNNLSENAGTTENGAISQSALGEETATLAAAGAGEDGGNKPVSNALPTTPPFKVRRVKLTSRRISTSRPFTEPPTTPIFSVSLTSSDIMASATPSLTAAAASGATDYAHMSNIRPSISSGNRDHPPLFSSRRVFKQEFGITRNSYGGDDGDDDDDDDDDSELQATTEFFSLENPTPYPMGVRAITSSESDDNDEKTRTYEKKDADNQDGSNNYRDYYSDGRSPSVEHGSGANLHIKSDSHDRESTSPVTVTVTHTVVQSTPQITPTATMPATEASLRNRMKGSSSGDSSRVNANNDQHGDSPGGEKKAEKDNHPNLLPTPALPPSIFVSSTAIPSFETGQGPIISHSVDDVQVSTTRYGVTTAGIQSTHYDDHDGDDDHDSSHKGNDQVQNHKSNGNEDDGSVAPEQNPNTPAMPQNIHPTPTISQKNIKSVYFTQVEHPHFTSSSYEFTTSSMYSYFYPDHDPHHPDMMNHDHDHDEHEDTTHYHPHPGDDENNRKITESQPEYEAHPDAYLNGNHSKTTTISDGNHITASPTPPQFWDDLGMTSVTLNLTKSSSSQVPITMDQENGGVPTPTIDIDIYPPLGAGPNSKVEDGTTTPVTTGRPTTSGPDVTTPKLDSVSPNRVPGSVEENEISEEELRKQQQNAVEKSTTKPDSDGVTNTKAKGDEVSVPSANDNSGSSENELSNNVSGEGGVDFNSGNGKGSESSATKKDAKNKDIPLEMKTPFGVGEAFGIGTVHVPVMVQMVLDVTQPVFCSHLTGFKEMIVTVYGTKKNKQVDPEQIVIFTEPGCDSKGNSDNGTKSTSHPDSHVTTRKPGSQGGKVLTTSKGTYPLTSPPHSGDDEGNRKARSEKTLAPSKNVTTTSNSDSSSVGELKRLNDSSLSSTRNKNISDLDSNTNKSAAVENTEISAHQNKSLAAAGLIRSRRSTKMATAGAATKNTNISEDIKSNPGSNSSSGGGDDEKMLSVYFYVNNKNGSYDKNLTSSFVELWNDPSRLTNVSSSHNGDGGAGGNDGSSNFNSNEMFIRRVKHVGMITASHLLQAPDPSDENSGIIVAITVAAIVAVCLFLLGVGLLVMRHRQSQTKFAKRCTPVTLDDYSLDNISVYNSFRRKQRLRGSKRSYTNAAFDDTNVPSRPVNQPALASALTDITSLENEFRAIPNITPTLDDIPSGAETKNRYANVIPMPDTRVLLTFQEDTPNSDYINANYVRGVNGEPKRYIVTQGPLDDTIVEFWRMVWEQQIRVIFMLTDFAEGGIAKCAEYYPRSETIDCSQLHGDYQITLEKRDISDNCITSYLVLKDMERNLRRDVVHFWYHSWPEKGVPASPKMTIDFLNRSRKFTKEPTPVLVHCSPGTGRSGAVVACDIAMKEYDTQNKVDIPRLVNKIRHDRAGAVQTKEQYVHIYQVLHSHASRIGAAHLESI